MSGQSLVIRKALLTLRDMVQTYEDDEYVMEDDFDALDTFLMSTLTLEDEALLLEFWSNGKNLHPNWKRELLSYFARIRTKNPSILKTLCEYWDEDPLNSALFLQDYPNPKLFNVCSDWIEGYTPWFKYIGSQTEYNTIDHVDWVEATTAWVNYQYPEKFASFNDQAKKLKGKKLQKFMDDEILRREEVIERYFLSKFPEKVEDWLSNTELDPEYRKEFTEMIKKLK